MSRILIVEDDPAILVGLKDNLEFESHQVVTATDGETGYRLLSEQTPDLVILDLMLPKLNGYDLCKRVRGEGFGGPILMLSARSQEGDRVMGLDLGANDYVSKPFSLRELLARVRSLLRHERDHRQNEEQLTGELEMAARVQRDLFPRVLPEAPGLDYAGLCRPARGVSGDYYDFLELGDGKLGLLLADVSGKGMAAALLGASLHAAVRAHARASGAQCGDVMAKANRLLFDTSPPDRFATVFYGVYDGATRVLTFANAGHVPPILLRGGECTRLNSLTPPAGLFAVLPATESAVQLIRGDCLLIFSDGVSEAENENQEEFGEDRLSGVLAGLSGMPAKELCEGVAQQVRNYAGGGRQMDDITLIALKLL